MRVLIVDDEPLARRGVRARLQRAGGVEVVGECAGGRDAVAAIAELAPDVVFLDVQMPGLDGFGVVAAVGAARMPATIFVTAFDEHALRAFDAHALDYLLKPIDDERFTRALDRARAQLDQRRGAELAGRLAAVLAEHGAAASPPAGHPAAPPLAAGEPAAPLLRSAGDAGIPRFVVRERDRVVLVDAADVDWIEAEGDYVRLHVGPRTHLVRATMAALEQELPADRFLRIHRSTIVNAARVRELRPYSGREWTVVLRDGTLLRMSRNYRGRLVGLLGESL